MNRFFEFVKTTLKGGVWFLFPFVVLVIVIGKAQEITVRFVAPLADRIPVRSILGMGLARVLAVVILFLFCFIAGLFSKSRSARKIAGWLELHFLTKFPGYEFLKSLGAHKLQLEKKESPTVVLARIEESWQIGYITEELDNGLFAVFVPDAPMPFSGGLYFMTEDRFQRLTISISDAQQCLRRLGHGSKNIFPGQKGVGR
jgi:uncharacterized membrane protein